MISKFLDILLVLQIRSQNQTEKLLEHSWESNVQVNPLHY